MFCFAALAVAGAAGRGGWAVTIFAWSFSTVVALELVASLGYVAGGQRRDAGLYFTMILPPLVLVVGLVVAERRILYIFAACAAFYVIMTVHHLCRVRPRAIEA